MRNTQFTENVARQGGAIFTTSAANVEITGCQFTDNRAVGALALSVWLLFCTLLVSAYSLHHLVFVVNAGLVNPLDQTGGGALAFINSVAARVLITSSTFTANSARGYGGAIRTKQHPVRVALLFARIPFRCRCNVLLLLSCSFCVASSILSVITRFCLRVHRLRFAAARWSTTASTLRMAARCTRQRACQFL